MIFFFASLGFHCKLIVCGGMSDCEQTGRISCTLAFVQLSQFSLGCQTAIFIFLLLPSSNN